MNKTNAVGVEKNWNSILSQYMKKHQLKSITVANLLGVSLYTVLSWIAPIDSKKHRKMKGCMLELLKIKIQYGKKNEDKRRQDGTQTAPRSNYLRRGKRTKGVGGNSR